MVATGEDIKAIYDLRFQIYHLWYIDNHLYGSTQAASSLSNAGPIFSSGFTFSSLSISRSKGGVWGAVRRNSIASFQLIEPCPGHRCVSLSLALSWIWVEHTCGFRISNASVTFDMMCAWPTSKQTPTSSKCAAWMNSTSLSGVER